jgi:hypothetical protein
MDVQQLEMDNAIHSFIAVEVNWKVIQFGVHVGTKKIIREFIGVNIASVMAIEHYLVTIGEMFSRN